MRRFPAIDEAIASTALALMTLIPLVEIALRPLHGKGIANAAMLVQHLGLAVAMFGAVLAERGGHLSTLGNGFANARSPWLKQAAGVFANGGAAILSGMLGAGRMELLDPIGPDLWALPCPRALDHTPPGDWTIAIHRDASGRATGATVGCWLARGLRYERVGA